jgi:N-formylglutamate deformylase
MKVFELQAGTAALLISFPHSGTAIPESIEARLTPIARTRPDTDWHLPRLYDFAGGLGASTLVAEISRYVIDLNRPPEGANLYPGQDTTGLVPIDTFHKQPLYRDGDTPAQDEIDERLERYWIPYHQALAGELQRLRAQHGYAVLWDAHSIASVLPRFFVGKLPDLNLGTADGKSCDAALQTAVEAEFSRQDVCTWVANGRFKGGYITRRYGEPGRRIHALQLEQSLASYMNENPPFDYRADLASRVQPILRRALAAALNQASRTGLA